MITHLNSRTITPEEHDFMAAVFTILMAGHGCYGLHYEFHYNYLAAKPSAGILTSVDATTGYYSV